MNLVMIVCLIIFFFIPVIIAAVRKHKDFQSINGLSILMGVCMILGQWFPEFSLIVTTLLWIFAFVWSIRCKG